MSFCRAADTARFSVWERFVHPGNRMFYDYSVPGEPGFPYLPTPDEIAQAFPNAAGWGTGMENCALNAGQTLPGALLRHELAPDEHTEREARTLFLGLRRLFAVAMVPGFLPRGVALDCLSHYPNSSADQYTMVFYALNAYYRSAIATEQERRDIERMWHSVLVRWERDGWEDRREDGSEAWYGDMDAITPDRGCRLLAALLGGYVVTGDEHWQAVYRQKLEEQDYARLTTPTPSLRGALYVFDQNQVAWRLLWELEEVAGIRQHYQDRMTETAEAVKGRLPAFRQFDPGEHSRLLAASAWDWRKGCVPVAQGENWGADYNGRLRQLAPVFLYEHEYVQSPWEAAHVLSLSEHPDHHRLLRQHLPDLTQTYPYESLALSWSLYDTEWTCWTMLERG